MKVEIVATLFRSAPFVREFYERAKLAASGLTDDFGFLFVNDGSPDSSLEIALELRSQDPRVCVIDLSRNFGHHKAMMTGLRHSVGDLVFLVDVDLEEPPELLIPLASALEQQQADVAYGVQRRRKGGLAERLTGWLFYSLLRLLSDAQIPPNVLVARVMSRRYVQALVEHEESELLIGGLWATTGFRQVPVLCDKLSRRGTTYTFARRLTLVLRGITAFSSRPLVFISLLGAAIFVASLIYVSYLVAVRLVFGEPPSGFTAIIVSVWLLGGLMILSIGIVAIYLAVVFSEVKRRPYVIIKHIHGESRRAGVRDSKATDEISD